MGVVMRMPSTTKRSSAAQERCAIRYPVSLPVRLIVNGQEYEAVTENMSASGVLLRTNTLIKTGTKIEFLVEVPAGVLGFLETAAMHCIGRVTRAYEQAPYIYAAAVIDEYRFQ